MPRKIESYNSSYPLAYYEIGQVYSFYGQAGNKVEAASPDDVRKYSGVLKELSLQEKSNAIKPVKSSSGGTGFVRKLERYYAVVVKKISGTQAKIVVMFLNISNGQETYLTRSYAVSFGCNTDGKDLMPASSSLNKRYGGTSVSKPGGITKAGKNDEVRIGGITRSGKSEQQSGSIGGITLANRSEKGIPSQRNQNENIPLANSPQIGGITRVNKVGGITRLKK